MMLRVTPMCLATIFLANLVSPHAATVVSAQEFTRSTIPLKSGGSITSIESQGRSVNYLNRAAPERTADARNAFNSGSRNLGFNTNPNTTSDRHEAGFAQAPNVSAGSSSRQQQNAADNDTYPYPVLNNRANASVGTGFNAQLTSAANRTDNSRTDFRFDRTGFGERPSGALGDTSNAAATNRVAQLPQPPTQLPQILPNPATALPAVPTFGGAQNFNLGPNYVNPLANFNGFQGFGAQPQAANTVPALNIQFPQTAVGNNTNSNCCCVPQANCCCTPQPTAAANNFNAFQFQQGIGTPQLNHNNRPFCSLFSGLGSGGRFGTATGSINPMIQFRNNPPGTYLGQGLIGQPTAYVDGQPFRNLFRYVTP